MGFVRLKKETGKRRGSVEKRKTRRTGVEMLIKKGLGSPRGAEKEESVATIRSFQSNQELKKRSNDVTKG